MPLAAAIKNRSEKANTNPTGALSTRYPFPFSASTPKKEYAAVKSPPSANVKRKKAIAATACVLSFPPLSASTVKSKPPAILMK